VTGAGGVVLSVRSDGAGPAVVLVHGTIGDAGNWAMVAPLLAEHFRVISYDRRGRGRSSDGSQYCFASEVTDLIAVVESAQQPVHVVAHSFGALLALAAASEAHARSLLLYEPPIGLRRTHPLVTSIERATAAGDWEAVATEFLTLAGATGDEIATTRDSPTAWASVLNAAPTVSREIRAITEGGVASEAVIDAARRRIPTRVVLGELTDDDVFLDGFEQLAARLSATRATLRGQRHLALLTAPEAFAAPVRDWLGTHPDPEG
jgi:pimeloyl-ACP methyl ester carboxylesterase